jgi:glutaconate CoA-transferase subunit B
MSDYSASEMMIAAAARALAGVRTVFVGVGLPNIACNLAQRTFASDLELIYESGVYGAKPARLPLSIGDPTLVSGSKSICSLPDMFGLYLQGGLVEVAILGGAQIDRFGNLNTTVIGDWQRPKVRLPGSGGACEIATHAQRIFVIMRLKRRAFVEKLDFLTSPGHLGGGKAREELGLPGEGPELVITDRCVFSFDESSREMVLKSLHPGVELEDVQAEVAWDLNIDPDLGTTQEPSKQELSLLRGELDPQGLYR